jgi:hypothetical protein
MIQKDFSLIPDFLFFMKVFQVPAAAMAGGAGRRAGPL